MKLRDFIHRYYIPKHVNELRPSTKMSYGYALEKYIVPLLGDREIDSFNKLDWVDFRNALLRQKLSLKTINNKKSILRNLLALAEEWEILEKVAPKIKSERFQLPDIFWLREPQERAIRTAAQLERNYTFYAMVIVALNTGCRIGELRGLQWRHFSAESGEYTLRIEQSIPWGVNRVGPTKNGKVRVLAANELVVQVLQTLHRTTGHCSFVFSDPSKPLAHVTEKACRSAIERITRKAGVVGCTWHTLRHTVASRLANNPAIALVQVQELLGHVDLKMTMRYVHPDTTLARQTTAALQNF